MEWFPELNLVLYGGWMPLGFALAVEVLSLLAMPRPVKSRLFDQHGWSRKQRIFLLGGKLFSLTCLVLIILSPMNMESIPFILGLMLYTVALPCLVLSMLNYKDVPPGKPATKGLYEHSRNPQIVSLFTIVLGIGLMIHSLPAILALLASRALQHPTILAEEDACLKLYGEAYRSYMKKVPRYL